MHTTTWTGFSAVNFIYLSIHTINFTLNFRPDKYAAMSVDARQELDLKIGVAFSRLMTRAYLDLAKEKFRIRDLKVISFGPCQTPTLWFCVQRHREIQVMSDESLNTPDSYYP